MSTHDIGSIHSAHKERSKQNIVRPLLVGLIVVLVIIVLAQIVMNFIINPNMKLNKVDVNASSGYDENFVFDKTGINYDSIFGEIDLVKIKHDLLNIPDIKQVEIETSFPASIQFLIEKRSPLVQFILPEGLVVLIDEDGVAYDYIHTKTAYDNPIISGIQFKNFALGLTLPDFIVKFLKQVADLNRSNPELLKAFSEFEAVSVGGLELEVLCYTAEFGVPVRIGSKIDGEICTTMLKVLNVLKKNTGFKHIKEIDLRSREVVIKKGEAS